MSIFRVPVPKDLTEEAGRLREEVERISYTTNLSLDRLAKDLRDVRDIAVRRGGDQMQGALAAPAIYAGVAPSGTEVLRGENARFGPTTITGNPTGEGETELYVVGRIGGALVVKRVLVGSADSAGAGYRVLRVTN